jgi:hypothetical protein
MIAGLRLWASMNKPLIMLASAAVTILLATALMWKTADIISRGGRAVGSIETNREGVNDADKANEGINAAADCNARPGRMWDIRTGKCGHRPAAGVQSP